MSVFGAQKFIFQIKKDDDLKRRFKADAEAALSAFPLSEEERRVLKSGDLVALYRMGVHPLLLAPYARFMGIPRPAYQEALSPLRGLLRLRS